MFSWLVLFARFDSQIAMESNVFMTNESKKTALFELDYNSNGRTQTIKLSVEQLVNTVGVSPKTARRWIDGTQRPHPHTLELLRIKVFGLVPDPAFSGFYFSDGAIHTPDGGNVSPRDLNALVWLRGLYFRGIKDNKAKQEEIDGILKLLPRIDAIRRKNRI